MKKAQDQKTEKQEQFIELRAGGDSYRTIAKKLNVCRATLTRWESELGDLDVLATYEEQGNRQ